MDSGLAAYAAPRNDIEVKRAFGAPSRWCSLQADWRNAIRPVVQTTDRTKVRGSPTTMPIIITDEDAIRLLSIPEAIEAMRVAFRDLADGKAANPPRLRYSSETPDPKRRYFANIHAGAVPSYRAACVRAGSHFVLMDGRDDKRRTLDNPDPVNWSVIILYDLATGEPLAFMHETH